MSAIWAALLALVGTSLIAAGTYFATRNLHRGKVGTSDAETIFHAAEALREEQRAELSLLRADVAGQREEIISLRTEITSLRAEIGALREDAARLRMEAERLRAETAQSNAEAAILRRMVAKQDAALSAVRREVVGAELLKQDQTREEPQ